MNITREVLDPAHETLASLRSLRDNLHPGAIPSDTAPRSRPLNRWWGDGDPTGDDAKHGATVACDVAEFLVTSLRKAHAPAELRIETDRLLTELTGTIAEIRRHLAMFDVETGELLPEAAKALNLDP